jgi:hypothetical protein
VLYKWVEVPARQWLRQTPQKGSSDYTCQEKKTYVVRHI